jgi:hypothetical protein
VKRILEIHIYYRPVANKQQVMMSLSRMHSMGVNEDEILAVDRHNNISFVELVNTTNFPRPGKCPPVTLMTNAQ